MPDTMSAKGLHRFFATASLPASQSQDVAAGLVQAGLFAAEDDATSVAADGAPDWSSSEDLEVPAGQHTPDRPLRRGLSVTPIGRDGFRRDDDSMSDTVVVSEHVAGGTDDDDFMGKEDDVASRTEEPVELVSDSWGIGHVDLENDDDDDDDDLFGSGVDAGNLFTAATPPRRKKKGKKRPRTPSVAGLESHHDSSSRHSYAVSAADEAAGRSRSRSRSRTRIRRRWRASLPVQASAASSTGGDAPSAAAPAAVRVGLRRSSRLSSASLAAIETEAVAPSTQPVPPERRPKRRRLKRSRGREAVTSRPDDTAEAREAPRPTAEATEPREAALEAAAENTSAASRKRGSSAGGEAGTRGKRAKRGGDAPSPRPAGRATAAQPSEEACEGGRVAMMTTPDLDTQAKCSFCGNPLDVFRGILTSKSANGCKWKCGTCNTRLVQLHRSFGKWPIKQFTSLSDTMKKKFMKEVGGVKGQKNLKAAAINSLVTMQISLWKSSKHGDYLPLSVYSKNGWDIEAIKANCPMKIHEELQIPTYKVNISGESEETIEQSMRKELYELSDGAERNPRRFGTGIGNLGDGGDGEQPQAQKRTAATADTAPKPLLQDKNELKRKNKVRTDAVKIVTKIESVHGLLKKDLANKACRDVPQYVTTDAQSAFTAIDLVLKAASFATAAKEPTLDVTLTDVVPLVQKTVAVRKF